MALRNVCLVVVASVIASVIGMGLPVTTFAQSSGIHVTGQGSVEVEPDMGYVRLHARREGTDAGALKVELDEVVRSVLVIAADLNIAPRDVSATVLSINSRHRRRGEETIVDGLVANRTVSITLRQLDQFGALMGEALASGINNVEPIRLDTSRRESIENEALNLAMRDAQEEAARVAAGFSVALGAVSDVHVSGHTPRPVMQAARAEFASSATPFSPGVIRVQRNVQATFEILVEK